MEVYETFIERYDHGAAPPEISRELVNKFHETIEEPLDSSNFWFALAKAQWECKALSPEVLQKVAEIVESGVDLDSYRALGASAKDCRERRRSQESLLRRITSERSKPRTRRRRVLPASDPIYPVGACLGFNFTDGTFGGAVVIGTLKNVERGVILVFSKLISKTLPNIRDVLRSEMIWVEDELFNFSGYMNVGFMPVDPYDPDPHVRIIGLVDVELTEYYTKPKLFLGPFASLVKLAEKNISTRTPRSIKRLSAMSLIRRVRWWEVWR